MKLRNPFRKYISTQLRKKNWSAPAIISVFILIMMILVYSFESLGLLNKERNLDLRHTNPENIIKNSYRDMKTMHSEKFKDNLTKEKNSDFLNENLLSKINRQAQKNKEEHLIKMQKILINGAYSQIIYEIGERNTLIDKHFFFEKFFNVQKCNINLTKNVSKELNKVYNEDCNNNGDCKRNSLIYIN